MSEKNDNLLYAHATLQSWARGEGSENGSNINYYYLLSTVGRKHRPSLWGREPIIFRSPVSI